MKISIKFTNLDSTPSIKTYVEEKIGALEKLLGHWEDHGELEARVEVARRSMHHKKGEVYRAEINLPMPGTMLRAEDRDFDIRVAIDKARDRLQREIKKYKDLHGGDKSRESIRTMQPED